MTRSPRPSAGRVDDRVRRLKQVTDQGVDVKVCQALSEIRTTGRVHPADVRVRQTFVRRERPFGGDVDDRRLPPSDERPVACRLLAPRGIALQVYLVALYVAQHGVGGGKGFTNKLPIVKPAKGGLCWSDLVTAPVVLGDRRKRGITVASPATNRERQVRSALNRLAASEVRLVDLPNQLAPRNRQARFELLDEAGVTAYAAPVAYRVPKVNEPIVSVPPEFFTNGWVHALTHGEIAAWLMFRTQAALGVVDNDGLFVTGETRLRYYGQSRAGYESYKTLKRFGLLDVHPAPGRRDDGTYEDFDPDAPPPAHRFRLLDEGLRRPAVHTILSAFKR